MQFLFPHSRCCRCCCCCCCCCQLLAFHPPSGRDIRPAQTHPNSLNLMRCPIRRIRISYDYCPVLLLPTTLGPFPPPARVAPLPPPPAAPGLGGARPSCVQYINPSLPTRPAPPLAGAPRPSRGSARVHSPRGRAGPRARANSAGGSCTSIAIDPPAPTPVASRRSSWRCTAG
jgi:hypothetical protein